jgi:hypothetical protein
LSLTVSNRPTDVNYPLTGHSGSTERCDHVREHNEAMNRIDFIESHEPITIQCDPGTLNLSGCRFHPDT